jgi:uncharacterized coiled-coil protein SlyX
VRESRRGVPDVLGGEVTEQDMAWDKAIEALEALVERIEAKER